MARHKITALKDITVSAHVWFRSSIELPQNPQGMSQGRVPMMKNEARRFRLQAGESRDDIAFLVNVSESEGYSPIRPMPNPLVVGERIQDGRLLTIEMVE